MAEQSLVIAVLTYLRPHDLRTLLPLLASQCDEVRGDALAAEVLVVDNDPAGSAQAIVDELGLPAVMYVHEPIPGISAGRNRALAESSTKDLLVFIDDDERPSERWLDLLLQTKQDLQADVVQGPVFSEYEVEPDSWIQSGGFFRRRRMPTGTVLDVAVTNNLLLDLRTVRRTGLSFDPSLGTTGGEDTLFTRQLHRAGARMVWCAEAYVVDMVPAARSTRTWVRQRALSMGNAASLVDLRLAPPGSRRTARRLTLLARGVARAGGGGGRVIAGALIRSERHRARGTRTFLRGVGMVSGALGYEYQEYGRAKK